MDTPVRPPARPRTRVLGGRYELGGRVGAGGMATILRGWDRVMERHVAVKVLHAHLADDPRVLRRFATEAQHAAALEHPNIVAVYDQGEADLPYIVLEFVEGLSLREVLVQRGQLAPSEALALVLPIAAALQRAHDAGIVHRDVKPENVLVAEDGTVKVTDFGIARALAATSHTTTGTLIGSVHYMAPELVDGREASPASDQYALGVLLFELLTDRRPLPADTPMAVALRHAREDIPPPSRHAPGIPPALDAVVARATRHRPEERFQDLRAFAAALTRALPDGSTPVTVELDGEDPDTLVIPAAELDTALLPVPPAEDEDGEPARTLARALLVGLAWTLGIAAVLAGLGYLVWDQVLVPVQTVPQLVGEDRDAAIAELAALGLDLRVAEEVHDLDAPEGTVLDQRPTAGTQLRSGGLVDVVVSLGPRTVAVPGVVGAPRDTAVTRLRAAGFEEVVAEEYSDDVPAGVVISQDPAAQVPRPEGTQVRLVVSLGVEHVEVPAVVGLPLEQASAALSGARLVLTVTEEWSDEHPTPGTVVAQSLEAGELVPHSSSVALVVSRGPLTVEVPNLIDLPVEEARAALAALHLEVREVSEPVPSFGPLRFGPVGVVVDQSPAPGDAVVRGDAVTIKYYTSPEGGRGNGNGRQDDGDD